MELLIMEKQKEEILKVVKKIVSQALKIDENIIFIQSSLIRDLGAESIDFLDIIFQLEKTFKIKIPKGELFPEKILTDPTFMKEGRVTAPGIEQLKMNMPSGKWDDFSKNPIAANLGEIFTVGMIIDYLSDKLARHKGCEEK